MQCIGHGGASALAPANTVRSFALAAELGADLVEFDVRLARGRLLLAHTRLHARRPGCLELEPALRALAEPRFDRVGVVVDLKTAGIEEPVLDALRRHGLFDRALVTSQRRPILARLRAYDRSVRVGISVAGRVSRRIHGWDEWREEVVAEVRTRRYEAVMAHRRLVDPELVDRVAGAGAELHAWTARGARDVRALAALGVDGVVTPDPRLVRAA